MTETKSEYDIEKNRETQTELVSEFNEFTKQAKKIEDAIRGVELTLSNW